MSNGLTINTSLDKDRQLQLLLERQAEITAQNADLQAQISALQQQSQVSTSAPSPSYLQHQRTPINKNHLQRNDNPPYPPLVPFLPIPEPVLMTTGPSPIPASKSPLPTVPIVNLDGQKELERKHVCAKR
ncbi:hypothetical protein M7I_7174 [Glarea lozoyensis 74030]|uniref:Uncharacterized protein n=1 Tax=Glarea lozoyensis (strain ATCC 74030 / MF5533) TaxID=1104152 RepID=H0EWK6_GLAL7|nr:hypothetical protein M7I_7174 [Glarea lozoyensis 74030]